MSEKQKNGKTGSQMAKPSYHAYHTDENLIDKIRIVFSRPAKKIRDYLSRTKNWIKNHKNPVNDQDLTKTELVEDHILDSMCSVEEAVAGEETEFASQDTHTAPALHDDEQYIGKHARKQA